MRERADVEREEIRRLEHLIAAIAAIISGVVLPLLYFRLMIETFTPFTLRGWLLVAAVSLTCIGTGAVFVRRHRRR